MVGALVSLAAAVFVINDNHRRAGDRRDIFPF